MDDLVVAAVFVSLLVVALVFARRRKREVHRRAETVELLITPKTVERTLRDGRHETVNWADLTAVEVVTTPVRTADGAKEFVLLYESLDHGALVPLGVGYDEQLLVELSRLNGFDLQRFELLRSEQPPSRQICWGTKTAD